ncbi:MAG TPA: carboxymuconolactone decarboxylase family protein [Stellaceae bacterium]|nr:carboxymuconolactone decarboxylase family protein [Stellaceae bacterium]
MNKQSKSISRLPRLEEPLEDALLAETFAGIRARGAALWNIHRVSGHAPRLFAATARYAGALRNDVSLPQALREMVILRTAQVAESAYEQSVHRSIALKCGVSAAKIAALTAWRDSPLFDERERAVLAYTDQAAKDGNVDDPTFAALRRLYSPQEIVELTATIAWYTGNARFTKALRIAPEEDGAG